MQAHLRDRITGTTEPVSLDNAGVGASVVVGETVSTDDAGRYVVFTSLDSGIAPGTNNLNPDTSWCATV